MSKSHLVSMNIIQVTSRFRFDHDLRPVSPNPLAPQRVPES